MPATPRIFDAFPFNGELDLLEHRLRETWGLVDSYVLVEAAETFRGQPKPLHFQAHRARFAWAASRLRPISLPRLPGPDPRQREFFQRNAVMLGMRDLRAQDVVLIVDADEIPSRSVLERLRREGLEKPHRLSMTKTEANAAPSISNAGVAVRGLDLRGDVADVLPARSPWELRHRALRMPRLAEAGYIVGGHLAACPSG